jgi:hypothetical protein
LEGTSRGVCVWRGRRRRDGVQRCAEMWREVERGGGEEVRGRRKGGERPDHEASEWGRKTVDTTL